MDKFTFSVITYNQEKYIGLHLESIKYLVVNYGMNIDVSLCVHDDSSQDNTVNETYRWLEKNRGLFSSVDVVVNEKNMGICANYQRALRNIKSKYYKISAGDDIYCDVNIFKLCKEKTMIVTPLIRFDRNGVTNDIEWTVKRLYYSNNPKRMAQKMMRYSQPFGAPGVLWNWDLDDKELYKALSRFYYGEDSQLYEFLLFNESAQFEVMIEPIMLYRVSEGISTNLNDERYDAYRKAYLQEALKLKKEIFIHSLPENVLNPFYTINILLMLLYKYILKHFSKKIQSYDARMKEIIDSSGEHLRKIETLLHSSME